MPAYYRGAGSGPGAAPGIEHDELAALPSGPGEVHVTCMDYCASDYVEQQVDDLEDFIHRHRPEWVAVRWIDVDGLSDMNVVHTLATKYELHPLAVEDLLNLHDRPKVEPYGGEDTGIRARLFIVARSLVLVEERLISEQISISSGTTPCSRFARCRATSGIMSGSAYTPRAHGCGTTTPVSSSTRSWTRS